MIIIFRTNRRLARGVVGTLGKHRSETGHVPGKGRINIHLLLASLTAGLLGLAALGVGAGDKSAPPANAVQKQQYTCPMHPEVAKGAAGNCPKYGMKLVEKH